MKKITIGIWTLINGEGKQVHDGDVVRDLKGREVTVCGGLPPEDRGKVGRVKSINGDYLMPQSLDLYWVQDETAKEGRHA